MVYDMWYIVKINRHNIINFHRYGSDMKIMHFIGNLKPWLQKFNWSSRSVAEQGHLQAPLQYWWDIFLDKVHPSLDSAMVNFHFLYSYFLQIYTIQFKLKKNNLHYRRVNSIVDSIIDTLFKIILFIYVVEIDQSCGLYSNRKNNIMFLYWNTISYLQYESLFLSDRLTTNYISSTILHAALEKFCNWKWYVGKLLLLNWFYNSIVAQNYRRINKHIIQSLNRFVNINHLYFWWLYRYQNCFFIYRIIFYALDNNLHLINYLMCVYFYIKTSNQYSNESLTPSFL